MGLRYLMCMICCLMINNICTNKKINYNTITKFNADYHLSSNYGKTFMYILNVWTAHFSWMNFSSSGWQLCSQTILYALPRSCPNGKPVKTWKKKVLQTSSVPAQPAHSLQGHTAWTGDEEEQRESSGGKEGGTARQNLTMGWDVIDVNYNQGFDSCFKKTVSRTFWIKLYKNILDLIIAICSGSISRKKLSSADIDITLILMRAKPEICWW